MCVVVQGKYPIPKCDGSVYFRTLRLGKKRPGHKYGHVSGGCYRTDPQTSSYTTPRVSSRTSYGAVDTKCPTPRRAKLHTYCGRAFELGGKPKPDLNVLRFLIPIRRIWLFSFRCRLSRLTFSPFWLLTRCTVKKIYDFQK